MRFAFALVLLGACGGSDVGRGSGGPLEERSPEQHAGHESATVERAPRSPGRPFAPGPMADFAEAMTDLALSAVEGRALPPSPVAREGAEGPAVGYRDGVEQPLGEFSVIGFAFEVELVVKRGERLEGAEGAARWGSVHAVIGLTRNGPRLVEMRPRRVRPDGTASRAPAGMEGLTALTDTLVEDLRRADLSRWALGESDRCLLGNDSVWAQVQEDRPRSVHLQEVATLLRELPGPPLAYLLGDMAVLVALPDGRLMSLALELRRHGDEYRLRDAPLVEVGQIWPILASTRHHSVRGH